MFIARAARTGCSAILSTGSGSQRREGERKETSGREWARQTLRKRDRLRGLCCITVPLSMPVAVCPASSNFVRRFFLYRARLWVARRRRLCRRLPASLLSHSLPHSAPLLTLSPHQLLLPSLVDHVLKRVPMKFSLSPTCSWLVACVAATVAVDASPPPPPLAPQPPCVSGTASASGGVGSSSNRISSNSKSHARSPVTQAGSQQTEKQERQLRNITDLLDTLLLGYDPHLRPNMGGAPTEVWIDLEVRSMGPIAEMDMSYSMDCYFRQAWKDSRLAYDPNAFQGRPKNLALSVNMLDKIWKPDTYFYNGKKAYLHMITNPNKLLRIASDGMVLYSSR